jgi:hypothetical protein
MEHCFGVPSRQHGKGQNPDGFPVWIQRWDGLKCNILTNKLEQIHITSRNLLE